MMDSIASAAALLKPQSIAIVGASAEPHAPGGGVLANLERFKFQGPIHLVNKNRTDINGRPCLAAIDDLPLNVDVAVLAIPQQTIVSAVEACARRQVRSVIIFASGFAEAGEEGRLAQERIAAIGREHGMLVAGPNCLGYVNYVDGIPLTFGAVTPRPAEQRVGLAVLSQSGAISSVLRFACVGRNLPVSYGISTGNEVGVGVEDYLEYLVDDNATRLIVMYIEQFRRPRRFLELARRAHKNGKPIVLLHPGHSEAARKSAKSHTGAMVGDYGIMRTMVERAGVVFVDTLEQLTDVSELLFRYPPPKAGTAIITDSGAFKGLSLDYCSTIGLPLAPIAGETAATLRKVLPVFVEATNPLDLTAQSMRDGSLYGNTLTPLMADQDVGSVVFGVILGTLEVSQHRGRRVLASIPADTDKPVIFTVLGDDGPISEDFVKEVRAAGVPFFRSPERALRALAKITAYGRTQGSLPDRPATPQASLNLPDGSVIPEYRAKALFKAAGIPVPEGALATTMEEADAIAARIGYPVALKAQSAALSHKSDAGGVLLNVKNYAELSVAWKALGESLAAKTGIRLDGVLVERMGTPGIEIILGAKRDPKWGVAILVGLGGIWAEVLHDVVIMPTDLTVADIEARLRALKASRLFDGYRGQSKLDLAALTDAVIKLSRFVEAHPNITEIDINPMIAFADGVVALDALIVTGGPVAEN